MVEVAILTVSVFITVLPRRFKNEQVVGKEFLTMKWQALCRLKSECYNSKNLYRSYTLVLLTVSKQKVSQVEYDGVNTYQTLYI